MNQVFIAGSFNQKDDVAALAFELRARGIAVLDRWTNHRLPVPDQGFEDDLNVRATEVAAREDVADVVNCDTFVLFVHPEHVTSQARMFEYGIAHFLAKATYVIGPVLNLYHAVADERFETVADFLEYVDMERA